MFANTIYIENILLLVCCEYSIQKTVFVLYLLLCGTGHRDIHLRVYTHMTWILYLYVFQNISFGGPEEGLAERKQKYESLNHQF